MMASSAGLLSDESFCLKWQDFNANVNSSLKSLRSDGDLFDVSLVTREGELMAHKVILSAGSPFFRDLFKKSLRRQLPGVGTSIYSIYLIGVSYRNLSSVLDFVYEGEVNVLHRDLNDFLALAEELQIRGLTNSEEPNSPPLKPVPLPDQPSPKVAVAVDQDHRVEVTPDVDDSCDLSEDNVKEAAISVTRTTADEDDIVMTAMNPPTDEFCQADEEEPRRAKMFLDDHHEEGYDDNPDDDLRQDYSMLVDLPNGQCRCDDCNKLFAKRSYAISHVQRIHEQPQSYECCLCRKVIKNKFDFRSHIRRTHDIRGTRILQSYGKLVPR